MAKWRVRKISVLGHPIGWGVLEPEYYDEGAIYARQFETWAEAYEFAYGSAVAA